MALKNLRVERVSGECLSGIRTLATGLSAGPAVRAGASSTRALRSPRGARRAAGLEAEGALRSSETCAALAHPREGAGTVLLSSVC